MEKSMIEKIKTVMLIAVAVRLGNIRLIDNMLVSL